ncbi:hypothetical protein AeMF1_001518 [Aphanomyces euteiches]|nr:hypothetical protein AeMF1_001518 [Aphanomyces euteiches]
MRGCVRLVLLLFLLGVEPTKPFGIYLIRHGEKPHSDDNHHFSQRGQARAECLAHKLKPLHIRSLFCPAFDIATGKRGRACETLTPFAHAIHLPLQHTIDRDNYIALAHAARKSARDGAVLVAWEHKMLTKIAKALAGEVKIYPTKSFDLIWTFDPATRTFLNDTNEEC